MRNAAELYAEQRGVSVYPRFNPRVSASNYI